MSALRLVCVAVCLSLGLPLTGRADEPLAVTAVVRKLHPDKPGLERVGALRSRGVLELSSRDARFGGLSGLLVSADGRHLEAVSDLGHWIAARLRYDDGGKLSGLEQARIAPLPGLDGRPLAVKVDQDAESMAVIGDSLLVSFEHRHRIWRYARAASGAPVRPVALPATPGRAALTANDGLEAIVALPAGRLLAIASKSDGGARFPAFLLDNGAWQRLWYPRSAPYEPTGATLLPDGDLLVVERRFSLLGGLGIRLVRLAGDSLAPGALLQGETLAELAPPLAVDNLEGVATRRGAAGETLIYLISDDNFNPLQRTLLLLFELEE